MQNFLASRKKALKLLHGIQFGVTFFFTAFFLSSAGEIFQQNFSHWLKCEGAQTIQIRRRQRGRRRRGTSIYKHTYTSYILIYLINLQSANSVVELMSIWFTLRVQHAGKMFCLPVAGQAKVVTGCKENFKWFSRVSALANVVEVFTTN